MSDYDKLMRIVDKEVVSVKEFYQKALVYDIIW